MPSINLRLTDEEHAALERWAKDGHRSLQKEIIYRLFVSLPWTEAAREQLNLERMAAGGSERAQVIIDERRAEADEHFKPDFKPVRK